MTERTETALSVIGVTEPTWYIEVKNIKVPVIVTAQKGPCLYF